MSRLLTWVLRLLPLLGVAIALVGWQEWYPAGWLDTKGFTINLASSFTAACFGVPLAFFVLQRLVRGQDAIREKRRLLRRLNYVLDELANERTFLLSPYLTDEQAWWAHVYAWRSMNGAGQVAQAIFENATVSKATIADCANCIDSLVEALIHTLASPAYLRSHSWVTLAAAWRLLVEELVPEAALEGFQPIDPKLIFALTAWFDSGREGFSELDHLRPGGAIRYVEAWILEFQESEQYLNAADDEQFSLEHRDADRVRFEEACRALRSIQYRVAGYERLGWAITFARSKCREWASVE
ncbi:hypothetical protein [Actinomycetospora chibensis]|uniref:Uncharacterized protein n=1 Tax=Actinomycetospora chibensis TaxID=663606 RepID=A0ABV9RD84_9PSEU|nr:hypothetical protein [Actinomycetospora chibensis]MDD7925011.1 hypothetical protein [Actinomycetospora chibensis]